MPGEEGRKVVGHHAVALHRGIQAALADAGVQHIPHRDAVCQQGLHPLRVRRVRGEPVHLTGDPPERVARVAVVLGRRQRHHAGHIAADQQAGAGTDQRWQPAQDVGHSSHDPTPTIPYRYVDVVDSPDIADLLDGLEGDARAERAELIEWLLEQGITTGQIRDAYSPLLLASRRVLGDDGTLVSAREICESTGIDLDLLRRIQRAIGLPQSDDPDARIHPPAIDGDITSYVVKFMDLGFDEDRIVAVIRVIADGLAKTAEAIRFTALSAMMAAGATELEIAKLRSLLRQADPLLGPMIQDMLRLQLRHTMETEAVTAGGTRQGAPATRRPAGGGGLRRFGGLHPPRRGGAARGVGGPGAPSGRLDLRRGRATGAVHQVDRRCVMLVSPDPVPLLVTMLALVDATEAGEDFLRLRAGVATGMAVSRGGGGDWFGSPVNLASRITGGRTPGFGTGVRGRPRRDRRRCRVRVVLRRCTATQGIKDDTKLFRARLPNG